MIISVNGQKHNDVLRNNILKQNKNLVHGIKFVRYKRTN